MADRTLPHILVRAPAQSEAYSRRSRGGRRRPPAPTDRQQHGTRLKDSLETAVQQGVDRRQDRPTVEGASDGVYVVFESFPGVELAIQTLDPARARAPRPELMSVRLVPDGDDEIEQATVFVPDGGLSFFLSRIDQYIETADLTSPGRRRTNRNLLDRVREIRLATLEALWTDSESEFPIETGTPVWWEVWLRRRDDRELTRLRDFAEVSSVRVGPRSLVLADRIVALVAASPNDLGDALDSLDDLAELRRPRLTPDFFTDLPPIDQADWVDELVDRTTVAGLDAPAVCVLDTGVDHAHQLLAASLDPADCLTCDPSWGTDDHKGHGTEQAGLALYMDLQEALETKSNITLRHRLESVKILPRSGTNDPDLYGAVTADAVARAEINAPTRRRVMSMAITAPEITAANDPIHQGEPTSWSAAIDALSAGLSIAASDTGLVVLSEAEDADRRLIILAVGNVRNLDQQHLDRSDVEPCEDPSQAWNALSVGAFTENVEVTGLGWDDWTPVAPRSELSPFSRTSVPFNRVWPYKPDLVLEGGNAAVSPSGTTIDTPPSLQVLTTKRSSLGSQRPLAVTHGTSAATAQASAMAAQVMGEYPSLWPETVRAMLVHSARWTDQMATAFGGANSRGETAALVRRYGMGVPDLTRSIRSATDALTLVVQDTIHPFAAGRMREMHVHDLPWPAEVLADMGEAEVELRVTLSYFVEPNPGRRGWTRRHRYASHGLRFDMRRPTESTDEFRMRINDLALQEEERRTQTISDADQWVLGPVARGLGSIHSDIWRGTAAELADRGCIAVFPITGWWKELPSRDGSDRGARYALLVSIESPAADVDIWTPVAQQVGIPIEVET